MVCVYRKSQVSRTKSGLPRLIHRWYLWGECSNGIDGACTRISLLFPVNPPMPPDVPRKRISWQIIRRAGKIILNTQTLQTYDSGSSVPAVSSLAMVHQRLVADGLVEWTRPGSVGCCPAAVPWKGAPLASLRWYWLHTTFSGPFKNKFGLKGKGKQRLSPRNKEMAIEGLFFSFLSLCKQVYRPLQSWQEGDVSGIQHQEIFNIGVGAH